MVRADIWEEKTERKRELRSSAAAEGGGNNNRSSTEIRAKRAENGCGCRTLDGIASCESRESRESRERNQTRRLAQDSRAGQPGSRKRALRVTAWQEAAPAPKALGGE